MPRDFNPVKGVRPMPGERLCFHVTSDSRPGIQHRVDLEEYRFNGACSCENFQMRLARTLEDGAFPAAHLQCDHIKRAEKWFAYHVRAKLAAHDKLLAALMESA